MGNEESVSLTDEGNKLIQKLSRFHQEILRSLGPDLVESLQTVIEGASIEPRESGGQ